MKKGGYQILELNCKGNMHIYDDNNTDIIFGTIVISKEQSGNNTELYIKNLIKNYKTLLLKNILINNCYINLFTNCPQDKITYYIIDSSTTKGYIDMKSDDSQCIIKLNDDYIFVLKYTGLAIIYKLYKGAITQ